MIRGLLLALCLVLALPAVAQETTDPGDPYYWTDRMPPFDDGNFAPAFAHLTEAIRQGRERGFPNPDWGLLFVLLADLYRNDRGNAGYALRLTEEGLEVAAPWGEASAEVRSMLNVSMSYALADLGRYREAAEVGRLGLPLYRKGLGDGMADTYLSEIEQWEKGLATEANTSPLELARAALVEAGQAVDRGEYGRGIMLASRATLPEDAALDPAEVRRIAAEAGMITGRALYTMGRAEEAADVMGRAIDAALDVEATNAAGKPVWRQDPGVGMKRIAALFFWYGRAVMDLSAYDEANWSYQIADQITEDPLMRTNLLYVRARLMQLQGDEAGSRDLLRSAADASRAQGDEMQATWAEFYIALSLARDKPDAESRRQLAEVTERAVAERADDSQRTDRAFFLSEAADSLVNYPDSNRTALDFARRALADRMAMMQQSADSEAGTDSVARETSALVARLLLAANNEASQLPEAVCPPPDAVGMGCVIVLDTP